MRIWAASKLTHQSLLLDELDGWRFVADRADQS